MSYEQITTPLDGLVVPGADGDARYGIYDQGAHTFAWRPDGQRPVLWVSGSTHLEPGKAVRGGVPVVFPWFGSGRSGDQQPAHGFARVHPWTRDSVVDALEENGTLSVTHTLPRKYAEQLTDEFTCELKVTFSPTALELEMTVSNEGSAPFSYEQALHTYLAVSDVRRVRVLGLEGQSWTDTVPGADPGPHVQDGPITIDAQTDRIYHSPNTVVVEDPDWQRSIVVAKDGSADTVVWNPWVERAAAMADFGDHEWTQMLCIEAANIGDHAVSLDPGDMHTMSQTITLR